MPSKSIVTGGALLVGIVVTACTQAPHPVQITALSTTDSMSADRAITLPDVVVTPQPYARGSSPRPSSENRIPVSHFRVWLGYDSQVALHPYNERPRSLPRRRVRRRLRALARLPDQAVALRAPALHELSREPATGGGSSTPECWNGGL
jgi:hypothetical protein